MTVKALTLCTLKERLVHWTDQWQTKKQRNQCNNKTCLTLTKSMLVRDGFSFHNLLKQFTPLQVRKCPSRPSSMLHTSPLLCQLYQIPTILIYCFILFALYILRIWWAQWTNYSFIAILPSFFHYFVTGLTVGTGTSSKVCFSSSRPKYRLHHTGNVLCVCVCGISSITELL